MSAWRQVLSFARPVVVPGVVPGGLTWLLLRFGAAWVEYSGRTFKGVLPVGLFSARFRYAGGRISENA